MERVAFRPLLLRCAVAAMACDGELHDDEVEEIRRMVDALPYFAGADPDGEIPSIIERLSSGTDTYEAMFGDLSEAPLKQHQRYQALEALLNVVGADGKLEPAEVTFVRRAKDALGVDDTSFIVRFPRHVEIAMGAEAGSLEPLDGHVDLKHFEAREDEGAGENG